jgi:hypothetical protein
MRFKAEHTFRGIDLPTYEKLYFDESFNVELCKATKLDRTLVKRETVGSRLVRAVKVSPEGREIPGPVAAVLGSAKFEYTEHLDYELGKYAGKWRTEPFVLKDKILSSGTVAFAAVPGGVRRVVEGDIQVKIFGVGGVIERFVVSDVERSYGKAAEFTQAWIDAKKHVG